jgi:hypothetical protein
MGFLKGAALLWAALVAALLPFVILSSARAGVMSGAYDVERAQMEKYSSYVSRDGKVLRLRLRSGARVEIRDLTDCDSWDGCEINLFIDYYENIGFYLIARDFYEGGSHILVSDVSGEERAFDARPYISPDGRRFVLVDEDTLYIWRIEGEKMTEEFARMSSEYAEFAFIEWINSDAILLNKHANSDGISCVEEGSMNTRVILKSDEKKGQGWEFYEHLSEEPVQCGTLWDLYKGH